VSYQPAALADVRFGGYCGLTSDVAPCPKIADKALRDFLVAKYPAAASLKESDIADSSFIDELERSGFIDRLYAADGK